MRGNNISEKKKIILMGLCGGKCEFRGCNNSVVEDMLTGDKSNFANYAHIIASSENGPRGNETLSNKLSNDENNIMVLCRNHHKEIDDFPEKYPEELLKKMKKEHEDFIRDLMNIKKENTAIGIKYSFNISDRVPKINDEDVKKCAFKQNYYCKGDIINLSGSKADERKDSVIYELEKENIKMNFYQLIKPLLKKEYVEKIFLCAIAPQPLLIYLGVLFSDISNVEVQQLQREPIQEWYLGNEDDEKFDVNVIVPEKKNEKVALNISITANIDEDRIRAIVGEKCDIIKIESTIHGNDIIKNKSQLEKYNKKITEVKKKVEDILDPKAEVTKADVVVLTAITNIVFNGTNINININVFFNDR